jgi:hypothetical protein
LTKGEKYLEAKTAGGEIGAGEETIYERGEVVTAGEGEVSPSSLNPPILKQLLIQMFKWKLKKKQLSYYNF